MNHGSLRKPFRGHKSYVTPQRLHVFIYEKSKTGKGFNGILEAAFNEVTIITAIHNIKSNKGANTRGIDGSRMDKYLQMDKNKLIGLIQKSIKDYKPKPVRRTYIKKANGKLRPLGIANVYLNDFDWTIGRMYHHPKSKYKNECNARTSLKREGIVPKYLIRYCDDWLIMTTMINEATRILKYLQKYYKYRLKLNLSKEKTLITSLEENRVKFLGYELLAASPRARPDNKGYKGLVGKFYPDKKKVIAKVDNICKEILKLKSMKDDKTRAAQVERINSIITGAAEYYKVAICSNTYRYMDHRIMQTAYRTFRKIYGRKYKEHLVQLLELSNRPHRHEKRKDKTFAVRYDEKWIGITKTYITHSQWDNYNYNQKMTPYTEEGRKLYIIEKKGSKKSPLARSPIYEDVELFNCDEKSLNNFEYYMNREYAYNRDKGRCKICGDNLKSNYRHCQRIDGTLPLDKINKVSNLAWFCYNCLKMVQSKNEPQEINTKMKSKILKYRKKLKVLN